MFAKDGYSVIAKVLILSAAISAAGYIWAPQWLSIALYILMGVFVVFTLYFFRDPDRTTPDDPSLLISPADGKVILKKEWDDHPYIGGPAIQISIFLSPLDVHVNRVPVTGIVDYAEYFPGKYLVAWHEKASELNERSEFGVTHPSGKKVFFNQITGYVARRITYNISLGDEVKAGDRFGMMKFGSRMDIAIPKDLNFEVEQNDRVVGGETILARID